MEQRMLTQRYLQFFIKRNWIIKILFYVLFIIFGIIVCDPQLIGRREERSLFTGIFFIAFGFYNIIKNRFPPNLSEAFIVYEDCVRDIQVRDAGRIKYPILSFEKSAKCGSGYIAANPVWAVYGPKDEFYVIRQKYGPKLIAIFPKAKYKIGPDMKYFFVDSNNESALIDPIKNIY